MTDKNKQVNEIAIYILIIVVGIVVAQHMNVVTSESMEPVFFRGDIVLIEKTNFMGLSEFNPEDIQIGDIVIYNATWFKNGPVIHRVIGKGTDQNGEKFYVIKGDHNPIADPTVAYPSQILSKVITIGNIPLSIPKIGYINLKIKGL